MRYLPNETQPSCDLCERQLPTTDENELRRLGWVIFVSASRRDHFCPACGSHDPGWLEVINAPGAQR